MPRKRAYTDEEFVETWNTAANLQEITEKYQLTRQSAINRACKLRASGHLLRPAPSKDGKRRGPNKPYTDQEFIEAWNQANDPQELAERFLMTRQSVINRAACLRAKGCNLKLLGRRSGRKRFKVSTSLSTREIQLAIHLGHGCIAQGLSRIIQEYRKAHHA